MIKLKLSLKQLNSLVFAFNSLLPNQSSDRMVKVARSVLDKVVLKMRKKYIEESSKSTLFSQKKKFGFSLEYHEAHFLEQFILLHVNQWMNEYDRNVLNFIKSTLNQQLQ